MVVEVVEEVEVGSMAEEEERCSRKNGDRGPGRDIVASFVYQISLSPSLILKYSVLPFSSFILTLDIGCVPKVRSRFVTHTHTHT